MKWEYIIVEIGVDTSSEKRLKERGDTNGKLSSQHDSHPFQTTDNPQSNSAPRGYHNLTMLEQKSD